MTTGTQVREVVRSFHDAWTSGDVTTAGLFLAEKFTNLSPLTNYYTPEEYLASLRQFGQIVTGCDILSELYGDDEATLIYDLHTVTPVTPIRTAEHFRLTGGKISQTTLIFDATPWHAMLAERARQQSGQ